jgi:hypothetical protein
MASQESITTGTGEHVHHWVIEEPHGPVSRGACKRCGAAREFRNFFDDLVPQDERRPAA